MFEVEFNVIEWLLEESNPSVRYLSQTKILESSENSDDVIATKNKIMTYLPIVEILKNQKEDTYWFDPKKIRTTRNILEHSGN